MLSNGHDIPIGDIAKAISLSQATVTGIVERLEKKGLLIRKRDSIDRRRVLTVLTQEGRQLLDKTPPLMQRLFLETFGGLQDWEQTMILCALQRLADIMNSKPERS
jgi:DNA-binding MarR family transcriptional regulator